MAQTQQRQSENPVGLFCHSSNEYTLKEFIEVFKRKLPKVLVVTEGFYGIDDMHSIASEEIYRIEKIVKQPRIVLRQKNGSLLSIPEEYKFSKFQYLSSDGKVSKPKKLKQIIKKKKGRLHSLKIQFENDSKVEFVIVNEQMGFTSLGLLEFVDMYQEKYLIGFSLLQEELAPAAVAIPLYVDINVSDVTSMTKDSPTKLDVCLRKLPQHMRQACNRAELNEDISMLQRDYKPMSDDYQYIIPDHYVTLIRRQEDDQSSRTLDLNHPKPASQEVLLTQPLQIPSSRHSLTVTDTQPGDSGDNLLIRSSLSLPLPSPPVIGDRDIRGYERLKPLTNPENPYGSIAIYISLSDVPLDLSGLSKYRIADCLRLLNLQSHSDRFIKESIDGNLLSVLNESILVQEFNFTQFEAIKLMGFVRGWRPVEEEFV